MKIEGKNTTIQASAEAIFKLCSKCSKFGGTIPAQVTGFTATESECHFTIQGMANITLTIVEKIEFSKIHYHATANQPINLDLFINIKDLGLNSEAHVDIDIDAPVFMNGMLKSPLQNFADQLIGKIKEKAEQA